MTKFFQKPDKVTFKIFFLSFVWVLICTALAEIFREPLESVGIPPWTLYVANVLYFIKGNPNTKEGLLEGACGGIFGLICSIGLSYMVVWMEGLGVSAIIATLIPIAIFLFLTIALHPFVPYVFNTFALCFFSVSLAVTGGANDLPSLMHAIVDLGVGPWGHFAGVILGNAIMNGGIILMIALVGKNEAKKKTD